MSSILKALRKLEEERARKRETAPEIATSILRVDARRKLFPLWLWPAVVIGVMLLVAAVFWGLRPTPTPPEVHSVSGGSPASAVSRSAVNTDTIVEEILDTRVPALPVAVAPRTPRTSVSPTSQTREQLQSAAPSTGLTTPPVATAPMATAAALSGTSNAEPVLPVAPLPPTTELPAAHSQPLVSAIVWQEDRASRLAVVNGLPMMEGEVAGTAKILEIQTDNVVFSENGLNFSIAIKGE